MAQFYLSHWNDSEKVFVPEEINCKLKQYHFSMVRNLYRCIQKKYNGGILNYDEGINVPLVFQALWQALITARKIKLPILVIASDDSLVEWHYHLSQLGEIVILNSQNCERVLENNGFSIILAQQCNLKLLHPYRENEFSFVVVEDFDLIATKVLFKKLSGEFNVALSKRNFMIDRDYKILWHILNWISPGEFGKLNDFADFDRDHLDNLRNPYDEIWFSYNYNVGDYNLDDGDEEKKEYQETLRKWAKQNNLFSENAAKQNVRKRKINSCSNRTSKTKKHSEKSHEEMYDINYHESETQLAEDVNIKDNNANLQKSAVEGIRDVRDLNYSKLIREEVNTVHGKENGDVLSVKSPFLKSKYLNRKRNTFKFLDDKSKPEDNHKIVERGSEGIVSANKTSACMADNNLKKEACVGSGNNKITDVWKKSCEQLKEPTFSSFHPEKSDDKTRSSSKLVSKQTKSFSFDNPKNKTTSVAVQKQVFPSLEDILTFKKRDLNNLFVRKQARQVKETAYSKHVTKSFGYNLDKADVASLEEVFRCKRKLNNMPQVLKKLNEKSPIDVNYNTISMQFTFQDDLKRIKLCEPHRIVYKDLPKSCYKSVKVVSRATQTHNDVKATPIIAYKPFNGWPQRRVGASAIAIGSETHNGKANLFVASESTRARENLEDKIIEKSKKSEPGNKSTIQENSLRENNIDNQEDEGQELVLSIVEGRFVSQPAIVVDNINKDGEKLKTSNSVAEDNSSSKTFKRYNSRTLLGSLFGDSAECLQEEEENIAFKNKSSNKVGVGDSKSGSQSCNHLKVRTIDQINGENSSNNNNNNNRDIYDSLKFLFSTDDDGVISDNLAGSKSLGASYHGRHNFSSLFG